jgi:hypothetical protein
MQTVKFLRNPTSPENGATPAKHPLIPITTNAHAHAVLDMPPCYDPTISSSEVVTRIVIDLCPFA